MIYKNTAVHFDVNAQVKRSVSANIQFSTQDIGTAKLSFNLTKDGVPLPISKATHAKLFMKFTDGSQVYVNTEVEDALKGAIFYVLTPEQIKHAGTVHAELYVKYDNGQKMSVHKFSFEIDKALIDADIVPVAEYYFEDFETFKAEAEEMIDDLQTKFEMLDNIETKEGAQARADAAETNAKAYMDKHASKKDNPHGVTKDQIGLSKVDNVKQATKAEFDEHHSDNTRHINKAERTKWNAGQLYKLTDDNGGRMLIPDDTDLLTLPSGLYYGVSNKVVNSPEPKAVEWFHYDVSTNNARKTIVVTATANPKRWFGTIHTDGSFKGWQRFITDADAEVTWQSPTLLNGWKQYGTHKVQFSKNALGEVEIIGSITGGTIGFDVPAFMLPAGYRPIQMLHFIGVASSKGTGTTPQYHRTQIATDGTVYIQSCSNTVNPNEFITFGFKFKAA
ncbi:phage baseplate upper protein [Bacillus licheniformis]|nr:phage baseplate upper protein [Bacillus licheniformis]MBY8830952.1 phage baseplate upper protein [Bacillus licheniformis]MCM3754600.1 phage baseplate upper protein [Bacillus licheniformis]MDE1433502.1 phage baseplate upper protein [Bacillus licheniformis]MDO0599008.1 phage baseplate upper protein [Bacillus licheniformis]OIS81505.1 phage tail protein [Bacillus licheniformis]